MTEDTQLAETSAEKPIDLDAPAPEAKDPPKDEPAKEPEAEVKPEGDEPEGDEQAEKKKPSGSERLKRQKQRLAEELATERARREELERKLSGGTQDRTDARPGVDREPREDDFPNDYFAYERSRTAWEVRQAIRAERESEESVRRQARGNEARMELVDEYAEHVETVRERIPDFDQVVSKANAKITDELADEILSAGSKAPLISYYLAQNPEKLAQLVNMSGKALAREVGRIEARVHLPQAKKATEAPAPLSVPKGGASPAFDPFKTDDMDAYVKWRRAGGGTRKAS